jgi:hypothetical protein
VVISRTPACRCATRQAAGINRWRPGTSAALSLDATVSALRIRVEPTRLRVVASSCEGVTTCHPPVCAHWLATSITLNFLPDLHNQTIRAQEVSKKSASPLTPLLAPVLLDMHFCETLQQSPTLQARHQFLASLTFLQNIICPGDWLHNTCVDVVLGLGILLAYDVRPLYQQACGIYCSSARAELQVMLRCRSNHVQTRLAGIGARHSFCSAVGATPIYEQQLTYPEDQHQCPSPTLAL